MLNNVVRASSDPDTNAGMIDVASIVNKAVINRVAFRLPIRFLRQSRLAKTDAAGGKVVNVALFHAIVFGTVLQPESIAAGSSDFASLQCTMTRSLKVDGSRVQTGVGLAEDMQKGIVDRFRSLPMSRVAHISGRIVADALRNIIVVMLMVAVGYMLGFRFENGFVFAILGIVFAIFFGFAFSWVAALFGLITKDSETAQVFGFLWTFPLVFASSVFVPVKTMPGWLQAFANNQPVTHAVNTIRALAVGGPMDSVWKATIWIIGITVVVAPIAVNKYRRASS